MMSGKWAGVTSAPNRWPNCAGHWRLTRRWRCRRPANRPCRRESHDRPFTHLTGLYPTADAAILHSFHAAAETELEQGGFTMARITWVEDADAEGPLAELYTEIRSA